MSSFKYPNLQVNKKATSVVLIIFTIPIEFRYFFYVETY